MSIIVDWGDLDETILMWRFPRQWDGDDILVALDESRRLAESQQHPIDVLVDMQQIRKSPSNLMTIFKFALSQPIVNIRHIIVISYSSYFRSIFNVMQKMYPKLPKVRFADDANHAYEMIDTTQELSA